jgi:hypothetical protein
MAETWYVGVAFHNDSGPVHTAATVQMDATLNNFVIQECFPCDVEKSPWLHTIVDNTPVPVDGCITLSDRPGLGLDIEKEEIRKHPPQNRPVYGLYSKDSFLLTGVGGRTTNPAFDPETGRRGARAPRIFCPGKHERISNQKTKKSHLPDKTAGSTFILIVDRKNRSPPESSP